jgi:CheY-like chemotaxis protein
MVTHGRKKRHAGGLPVPPTVLICTFERVHMSAGSEILIVDDDRELVEALADTLVELGYRVSRAANGREALERLHAAPLPAVVLLDLNMPVMNGWQFCAAKKAQVGLQTVPVIVLSAAAKKDPASPYFLDVEEIVSKPIEMDELLGAIQRLLPGAPPT